MKAAAPTDLAGLARLILSPECRSIVALTGAGVSVAASIPDFRSPGGLYDTLRPELLTATEPQRRMMRDEPTSVVSWDLFKENQFPYLEVRRPFILGTRDGQWRATIAHRFFEMLHSRTGKLSRLYTQNIDGLDHQCTDLPSELIINVHGSISEASCEGCGRPVDDYRKFCDQVERQIKDIYCHNLQQQQESKERSKPQVQASPENPPHHPTESIPILCAGCGKPLVKPSTVLYGRKLPTRFWEHVQDDSRECDLLIVAGTSLEVAPANLIVRMVGDKCFRVVVNRERVGAHLGIDYRPDDPNRGKKPSRDCIAQGDADEVFLALIQELGWMDDLARKKELLPESSRLLLEREIAAGDSSRST